MRILSQISIREAIKIFAGYDSVVWYGVATAILVFVIEIILYSKKVIFSREYKRKEKAVKEGHVIKATQIKCTYHDRGDNNSRHYTSKYVYEVGGVKREKGITSVHKPPLHILLYYDKSPDKVFSDYDRGKESFKVILYILPILAAYLVMKAMGYSGH